MSDEKPPFEPMSELTFALWFSTLPVAKQMLVISCIKECRVIFEEMGIPINQDSLEIALGMVYHVVTKVDAEKQSEIDTLRRMFGEDPETN